MARPPSQAKVQPPQPARTPRETSRSRFDVRLATNLAQTRSASSATAWILCPWLERFPGINGVWLSVLAAHDANEGLLEALPASKKSWPKVYAGVFAIDPLRPTAQLIRRFKSAGIAGVINFPSASFIDGEAGAVLNVLSLGIDREIEFLQACSMEGLRIAGVTNSIEVAQRLVQIGADFLIAHGGPPTRNNPDPSRDVARLIEEVTPVLSTPVIPISRLRHRSRQDP
jgi:predicted TIM-barrel enzyme